MNKPKVFHIGIPKSGTTTIQSTLYKDDRLNVSRSRFLTSSDWWSKKTEHFSNNKIIIESNETLISGGFHKVKFVQVVERMFRTNPKADIIVTMREQKSALKSMFKFHIKNNFEGCKSFDHWLYESNLGMDYVSLCMYGNIARVLLAYFPKNQIHFMFFEELVNQPLNFYNRMYKILGLPLELDSIENEIKNAVVFDDNQLYTLAKLNTFSLVKRKSSGYNVFSENYKSIENRFKKGFIRRFVLKGKAQAFFNINAVPDIEQVFEDFKYSNLDLVQLGLVSKTDLEKYGYKN